MEVPSAGRYEKAGEYVIRRLSDETLLVPVRSKAADLDSIYVLNETSAAVWDLLDSTSVVEEIAGFVATRFDVDLEKALKDVGRHLALLEEGGLVRRADALPAQK